MNQSQTSSTKSENTESAGFFKRIPISIPIRFVLFIGILLIDWQIFGVDISLLLLFVLVAWSFFDFFRRNRKAKWRLKQKKPGGGPGSSAHFGQRT